MSFFSRIDSRLKENDFKLKSEKIIRMVFILFTCLMIPATYLEFVIDFCREDIKYIIEKKFQEGNISVNPEE